MPKQLDESALTYVHNMLLFMKQDSIEYPYMKKALEVIIRCIEDSYNVRPSYGTDIRNRNVIELADLLKGQFSHNHLIKILKTARKPRKPKRISNDEKAEKYDSEGKLLFDDHLYDEAIMKYSSAIELNPFNHVYYLNRGTAYYYQENYKECVKDCQRSVAVNPKASLSYGRLGIALCHLGRFGHAQAALLTALDIKPEHRLYRWLLTIVYQRLARELPVEYEINDFELQNAYILFEEDVFPKPVEPEEEENSALEGKPPTAEKSPAEEKPPIQEKPPVEEEEPADTNFEWDFTIVKPKLFYT